MKKYLALLLALAVMFTAGIAIADDGDIYNDGQWRITSSGTLQPKTDSANDIGSSSYQVSNIYADNFTMTSGQERSIEFNPKSFVLNDGYYIYPVTQSTAPGLEIDNLVPSLVWADSEVTPVMVTFKVPSDYKSGGAFRVFCDESNSTTPNQVDFSVYVNKDGQVWDSAATNQTPVALAGTAGTPDMITLTVGTDFTSLAAGDTVTLAIWRDNVATGTGDLEVYYAEFYYKSNR